MEKTNFEFLSLLYILTKTSLKAFFTSEKCLLYSLYTILLLVSKITVLTVTEPISIPIWNILCHPTIHRYINKLFIIKIYAKKDIYMKYTF